MSNSKDSASDFDLVSTGFMLGVLISVFSAIGFPACRASKELENSCEMTCLEHGTQMADVIDYGEHPRCVCTDAIFWFDPPEEQHGEWRPLNTSTD